MKARFISPRYGDQCSRERYEAEMAEIDASRYPTTRAELKTMIDAQWPEVRESSYALELYDAKSNRFIREPSEPRNCRQVGIYEVTSGTKCDVSLIPIVHRVLRPCGFETEGVACHQHPLLFTEEQAIRALWFQYNMLTPASDFATDTKGIFFVWREEPETKLWNGIWTARMRYSCLWHDRNGNLVTGPFAAAQKAA